MLDEADGPEGEAYRMLRTNIDLVNLDADARTIMITSAVEEEGKSTTLANLALVYARAGRRVLLADLDLRRPSLAQRFELAAAPGVTEVVAGRIALEDALQRVPLRDGVGRLDVLTSGAIPGNPGELVASGALDGLIEHMRARADIVLIDGPPMLLTGDTLTLSTKVDALIVTARSRVVRRPMLRDLARLLAASPTTKLGVVVTGATSQVTRGYYGHYASRQRDRELVS
jgi:non-specific protein-tyrosine kinase